MKIDVTIQTKGVVDLSQIVEEMKIEFGFTKNMFLKDDKIFAYEDIGWHKSDIVECLVTDCQQKVELFKAIEVLNKYIKK